MFPTLPRPARRRALFIALVALAALVAQWVYLMGHRVSGPAATLLEMTRFFTILTTALTVITFAMVNFRKIRGVGAGWLAALTASELLAAAVYHALLSDPWTPTGIGWWADLALHSLVPGCVALWWVFDARKQELDWADLPTFVLWLVIYGAYALARGAQDGVYLYPFMDLNRLGAWKVAATLAMLLILILLSGVVFIAMGRFANR